MIVYTLEQRWESGAAIDFQKQKKITLSDEAHFDLVGYVNKQNCRISGTEYIENLTHSIMRAIGFEDQLILFEHPGTSI